MALATTGDMAEDIGLSSYVHSSGAETLCELCGDSFPHPVTYHMHQAHPGCGQHAGGKGYNSGGSYCLGWAGNCGDGGVPGSSWYLLCESCRERYVKMNRTGKQINLRNRCIVRKKNAIKSLSSPTSTLEPHIVMKNNAMFLLELASSAETRMTHPRRSSMSIMPSVSENSSPPDYIGPFGPLPPFQCLQSLGANLHNDEPPFYDEILNKNNFYDGFGAGPSTFGQRLFLEPATGESQCVLPGTVSGPLSEVSMSDNDSDSSKGLRFHRSVSMGTNGIPWSKSGYDGRIIMMRKRNNSSCEIVNDEATHACGRSVANFLIGALKSDTASGNHRQGWITIGNLVSTLTFVGGRLFVAVQPFERTTETNTEKDNPSSVIVRNDINSEGGDDLKLLQRPVLLFILQQHDLDSLQLCMKQALRNQGTQLFTAPLEADIFEPVALYSEKPEFGLLSSSLLDI
ncbi:hypothetical protein NQ318_022264 [Aromia moschata]|uniref:C2H2-type domain-containing protein n=1 Tax=Aromia moschata TaxID=1265417 RepID=A0AAV8XFV7_9CUCU|nr:hypothetical protein NQ318_022264 [Aromia moschata]